MEEATACRTEQRTDAAHFCVYSYNSTQVNQKYSLESTERSNSIKEAAFLWKSGTVLHPSRNLYIHLHRDRLTMDLTGLAKSPWKEVIKEAQHTGTSWKSRREECTRLYTQRQCIIPEKQHQKTQHANEKNLLWSLTLLSKRSVHFVVSQNVSVKASEQLS